ncbi:Type I restriction-modification system, specificity subunit S, partial [hydrothermal vent metagenome]
DLVLKGQSKVPQKKYFQLQDALEESDLPIKVDVLDWHRITPEFRANIEKKYEVIMDAASFGSEWPIVTIDEIKDNKKGSIAIGPFGSRMKSDCYVDNGVPVIRGTNITGGPTFGGNFVYITEEKSKTLGSSNVFQYDLVFPHRGSIGEVGIILEDEHYVLSSSLMKLTCDRSKVNPKFLYYFFKSRLGRHELLKNASQVGTPGIGQPLSSLKSIEFRLPPLDIQNQLEEILTSLDNKIELNRQTNQTLEQIAQTIFKSWFVDFEPVKAKAQVRASVAQGKLPGSDQNTPLPKKNFNVEAAVERAAMCAISGKSLEELEQLSLETQQQLKTTAALFPGALVESELGEIPEGWEVGVIGDLFELHRGFDLPKKDRKDGFYPVYAAGGYHGQHSVFKMEPPGIITGRSGVIGNVYLSLTKYWPLNTTLYVRAFKRCGPYYAYFFLNMCDLKSINSDSAVPSLNCNFVHSMNCLIPASSLLDAFDKFTNSNFIKIKSNDSEVEQLSSLRDLLLPKLLSGGLVLGKRKDNEESVA